MQPIALIPVPFSSLAKLLATVSHFCSKESSILKAHTVNRNVSAGQTLRLALLAPELRFAVDINAQVVAQTFKPRTLKVKYAIADYAQVECALGQLYRNSEPRLPVALDVATFNHRACRLSELSGRGATFDIAGQLSPEDCTPDSETWLRLPHQSGCLNLPGHVAWVTPHPNRSRLHVAFSTIASSTRQGLNEIIYGMRLGAAPWTPRLLAQGL